MSSQEHNIEKVFKDAFDQFTPDVSAKVWSSVSQQLLHPVSPLAQPSASILKTAAAKLSTASTWIIGGIATTAIVGGILIYQGNDSNEVVALIVKSASVTETNVKGNAPITPPSAIESPAKTITQSNESSKTPDVNTAFENIKNEVLASGEKNESNYTENLIRTQAPATSNEVINKEDRDSPPEQQPSNVINPLADNTIVQKTETLILVNSTAGFAPLQVACLLNQEGLNGDWDFGDGSVQLHSSSATHKYVKPGSYILKCNTGESVITQTIEVIGRINTAFSPNGDGINDFFLVEANNLNNFSLRIFDRNGRQMVELNNTAEKWDGRTNGGETALTGTYFYELSATMENGKDIRQRGAVNLFR